MSSYAQSGRARIVPITGLVCLSVLPPLATMIGEPFLVTLFSRVLIYALAAVSLDLIVGYGGMVSLGHAAFFGTGAYVVGVLSFHHSEESLVLAWPIALPGTEHALVAWPLAAAVAAVVALVIGALSLRTHGVHFIMITLAFAQMLFFLFVSLEGYGGDDGLSLWSRNSFAGLDLGNDLGFYYVCLGCLVGFVLVCRRLVRSRFGMLIQASKYNEKRLRALGVSTYRYKLVCFVIAGAGAGLAGALIANQTEFVSPSLLHWTRSGEILVMVILGGMGTLYGPILGAAALLLLEEVFALYTEHWMLLLGPALILVVLFARGGIYGWLIGTDDRRE